MDAKINISIALCFAVFIAGMLSVGSGLLSGLFAALLFSPLLMAFFVVPAGLIALLLGCFKKRTASVDPHPWEDRMD